MIRSNTGLVARSAVGGAGRKVHESRPIAAVQPEFTHLRLGNEFAIDAELLSSGASVALRTSTAADRHAQAQPPRM
jgi:hypothetical protein